MKIHTEYVQELDSGERYHNYEESIDLADTYMGEDATIGEIYRASQKEHGRCTGKVYIDTQSRGTISVGWVFVKRQKFDDSSETFLMETWVTLVDKDETVREVIHHDISKAVRDNTDTS